MIITGKALERRTFLRGLGAAVALPFLDAMTPAFAASTKAPVRMAFVYVPNGIDMRHWNPTYEGKLGELPRILKPLEPFKSDITLLGNLTHNNGRALLDGAGDHGRCCGAYLTGVQPRKSAVDIKCGISVDQIVANKLRNETRFASLEIGLEDARQAGDCDSGYSCAYTNNLAWRSDNAAAAPDPRSAHPVRAPVRIRRRIDSGRAEAPIEVPPQHPRLRHAKIRQEAASQPRTDGPRKLDEYLSSIREIERQIAKAETDNAQSSRRTWTSRTASRPTSPSTSS
jgi:hypothetical protein